MIHSSLQQNAMSAAILQPFVAFQRFNVALTRSKALLITVGDPDVLQCDEYWQELIFFCKDNGGYTGCPLKIRTVSEQVEDVPFDLNSLLTDLAGNWDPCDATALEFTFN